VVDQATYLTASGNIPFNTTVHPGPIPNHSVGTTNVMMTHVDRQSFTTYRNTKAVLKRQIIQAVPGTYTNDLKDPILGFSNVSMLSFLQHL
jgi:hypothetical protein